MPGFDLDSLKALAESFMVDECTIYSPVDSTTRTLNKTTGVLSGSTPVELYSGKCQIWSGRQGAYLQPEAGGEARVSVWFVEIPRDSASIPVESHIVVGTVNSQANPTLSGLELRVVSVDLYTHSVSTIVKGELWEGVPT